MARSEEPSISSPPTKLLVKLDRSRSSSSFSVGSLARLSIVMNHCGVARKVTDDQSTDASLRADRVSIRESAPVPSARRDYIFEQPPQPDPPLRYRRPHRFQPPHNRNPGAPRYRDLPARSTAWWSR